MAFLNIFNVDYGNVSENLVPHFRRTQSDGETENRLLAFLRSIMTPLQTIGDNLNTLVEETQFFVNYTGQHKALEEYLNDLYDPTSRRIYITENDLPSGQTSLDLYKQTELDPSPISLYKQGEISPAPISLYKQGEAVSQYNFTVNIPTAVSYDATILTSQVNNYKEASKDFNIVTF